MHRILFEKTGNAVWISHLDVMRIFQRAFLRQQIPIAHTQGYSPHAFVSVILPLSVGTHSCCEILECKLEDSALTFEQVAQRLNETLPEGIRVLRVYEAQRKAKELAFLQARITLEYDAGTPDQAAEKLRDLFSRPVLTVEKKSKKGTQKIDIQPMLRRLEVEHADNTLTITAVVAAQNPSLNPQLLVGAIETYCPELIPSFFRIQRLEIFDASLQIFR